MQKMQRHFRFYKKGAPFPGQCVSSGNLTDLWDLGPIPGTPMTALLSDQSLRELATFAGYVTKEKYQNDVSALQQEVADLKAQLDVSPKMIKELTNGINGLLSTFVADLASISSPRKPVQPKGDSTGLGKPEDVTGSSVEAGQTEGSSTEPSTKSASK